MCQCNSRPRCIVLEICLCILHHGTNQTSDFPFFIYSNIFSHPVHFDMNILVSEWKLLSHIQHFVTPWTVVHGILQAFRILKWSFFLLQGITPTQGLNPGPPHCRQILFQLSYKGSPWMSLVGSIYWNCDKKTDEFWVLKISPSMVKLHPSKSSYYYGLVQEFIKYLIWKASLRVFHSPSDYRNQFAGKRHKKDIPIQSGSANIFKNLFRYRGLGEKEERNRKNFTN